MIGSKRKKSNMNSQVKSAETGEYSAERFLKGFEGMTNKEIHATLYLVDDGLPFEDAVEHIKNSRVPEKLL